MKMRKINNILEKKEENIMMLHYRHENILLKTLIKTKYGTSMKTDK